MPPLKVVLSPPPPEMISACIKTQESFAIRQSQLFENFIGPLSQSFLEIPTLHHFTITRAMETKMCKFDDLFLSTQ